MCLTPQILNCHNRFTGMDTDDVISDCSSFQLLLLFLYLIEYNAIEHGYCFPTWLLLLFCILIHTFNTLTYISRSRFSGDRCIFKCSSAQTSRWLHRISGQVGDIFNSGVRSANLSIDLWTVFSPLLKRMPAWKPAAKIEIHANVSDD